MMSEAAIVLVYKLVRRFVPEDERWYSAVAGGMSGVLYLVGVPAEAPAWLQTLGYHLLAYRTLPAAALAWQRAGDADSYAVFETDAEDLVSTPPPQGSLHMLDRGLVLGLGGRWGEWSEATVMARRLTLRRQMPVEVLRGF